MAKTYGLAVHPIKQQKERVQLRAKAFERPTPERKPLGGVQSSKGLVSHIWNEWACKNFDVE